MRLEKKVCIVTGGAMGIGRGCAQAFASEGATVVVIDVAEEQGRATVAEIQARGQNAEFIRADVASGSDCREAVDRTVAQHGRVDVMHANAAVELCKSILDTTDDEWRHLIGVNLSGVFFCCREALRAMRDRGTRGSIIVTSSPLAFASGRDIAAYTASKGGVLAFVRALALEAADAGIRANALLPGTTETPMIRREMAVASNPQAMLRRWADSVPLGRIAQPEDIARGAVYLASEDSSFMTGSQLVVDGGQTAVFNTGPVFGYTD
jgi:NAD(P)-dependent dehydrogenase (short-subunit alcohol dehydrogenase family)